MTKVIEFKNWPVKASLGLYHRTNERGETIHSMLVIQCGWLKFSLHFLGGNFATDLMNLLGGEVVTIPMTIRSESFPRAIKNFDVKALCLPRFDCPATGEVMDEKFRWIMPEEK